MSASLPLADILLSVSQHHCQYQCPCVVAKIIITALLLALASWCQCQGKQHDIIANVGIIAPIPALALQYHCWSSASCPWHHTIVASIGITASLLTLSSRNCCSYWHHGIFTGIDIMAALFASTSRHRCWHWHHLVKSGIPVCIWYKIYSRILHNYDIDWISTANNNQLCYEIKIHRLSEAIHQPN